MPKVGGNSSSATSTTNWEEHKIDFFFRYVFQHFHSYCSLPSNDLVVIERMNEYSTFIFASIFGTLIRFIKSVAIKFNLDVLLTPSSNCLIMVNLLHSIKFNCRSHSGHINDTLHPEESTSICHSLSMISSTGTKHSLCSFFRSQLTNFI